MIKIKYFLLVIISISLTISNCYGQTIPNLIDSSNEYYKALKVTIVHLESLKSFFHDKDLELGIINLEVPGLTGKKIPAIIGKNQIRILRESQIGKMIKLRRKVFVTVLSAMEFKNGLFMIRAGFFDVSQLKEDKYLYGDRGGLNIWFEFNCTNKEFNFLREESTDQ